jgi:Tfp pilus assembly protein PilN
MTVIVVAILCALLAWFELRSLYKTDKKQFWLYAGLLVAAFLLWALDALGGPLRPDGPAQGIVSGLYGGG